MISSLFGAIKIRLFSSPLSVYRNVLIEVRCRRGSSRFYSTEDRIDLRKIKFSDSPAFRRGPTPISQHPVLSKMDYYPSGFYRGQQLVIMGSFFVFLIYMMFFREPSDIDDLFDYERPLWKTFFDIEKQHLREKIILAKSRGENPENILHYEKRIAEIDREIKLKKIQEEELKAKKEKHLQR